MFRNICDSVGRMCTTARNNFVNNARRIIDSPLGQLALLGTGIIAVRTCHEYMQSLSGPVIPSDGTGLNSLVPDDICPIEQVCPIETCFWDAMSESAHRLYEESATGMSALVQDPNLEYSACDGLQQCLSAVRTVGSNNGEANTCSVWMDALTNSCSRSIDVCLRETGERLFSLGPAQPAYESDTGLKIDDVFVCSGTSTDPYTTVHSSYAINFSSK